MNFSFSLWLCAICFISCTSSENKTAKPISKQDKVSKNITALKEKAAAGDLIVRMSDDLISEQIKYLNEYEKIYSHAGIVIIKDNQPFVCNIAPNDSTNDTIQIVPVDSFINPAKNLKCALFRYDLSTAEKASLNTILLNYQAHNLRFDWLYDLDTDNRMYCAELIDKALQKATGNRIRIKQANIPVSMQATVFAFFKKEHVTKQMVTQRKIITIDNLYMRQDCKKIMSFSLKKLP
ncbi:MAG: YiiX/YebB-like N1pC/P60 family cysteine hydrolase [Ginsengibacter sp.]